VAAAPLFFRMNLVTLVIFLGIVGGEWISRRFWCRNLCPLGALLESSARFRRSGGESARFAAIADGASANARWRRFPANRDRR